MSKLKTRKGAFIMRKIKILITVFLVLMFIIQSTYLFAECYNEDACYKDYVKANDENVVVAVNRDTKQVELYWSEKDNAWLKPDAAYQKDLQKIYDKKTRLMDMQARLDKMRSENLYTTNQNSSMGRNR